MYFYDGVWDGIVSMVRHRYYVCTLVQYVRYQRTSDEAG